MATAAALTAGVVAPSATAAVTSAAVIEQRNAEVALTGVLDEIGAWLTEHADTNRSATNPGEGFEPMPLASNFFWGQAPNPADIPDLTLGAGRWTANALDTLGATGAKILPGALNLGVLWSILGLDPTATINDVLSTRVTDILNELPIRGLGLLGLAVLQPFLNITNDPPIDTLGGFLELLGFDTTDLLNMGGGLEGLNVITAGPLMDLVKFLGVNVGWVPGTTNSIADEANDTPPLESNLADVASAINDSIKCVGVAAACRSMKVTLSTTVLSLQGIFNNPNLAARAPVIVATGLGAFAAGEAYPQILDAALDRQQSLTLPISVLISNPGRANGGLFARIYPLAALAGINTVTRDQGKDGQAEVPVVPVPGIVPFKVDVTTEYNALADVPAWLNPVSLANTGAAALLPTHLLGGGEVVVMNSATNGYGTYKVNDLPLLEPLRLPNRVLNLGLNALGADVQFNTPIADALQPALKVLVNLGYTDVDQEDDYERTHQKANELTPFGTMPDVDWLKVPGDVVKALGDGIEESFKKGLIKKSTPETAGLLAVNAETSKSKLTSELRQAGKSLETGVKDALQATGLTPGKNSLVSKGAKEVRDTGRELRGKAKEAVDKVKTQVKETVAKVKKATGIK
ncbi:PE-PPE domain-containing protein [Mycolicibacterium brumae]|uniref:PE-PPE domain-containing protein n=1 Tax=Mycolicibacterium brumae TaxID=85968 RepID=UPI000FF98EA4|nr:PE-PPE domain-containing protein [Mycolicibacterium brumae]MCV7193398.1 PE-PPE domain-containing protein [Mycolicibacterium brumae]RWA22264.1 hypothetical protein MBRU_13305 [Mycolicibacterium brumae DSM 44177]UWW07233.1 PE-PPE domain-containing protein [Mycolicibacterium brumae]